jgi:histidine triad (HIT) family protein
VSKQHYAGLFDVPPDELSAVMGAVKDVVDLYHAKLGLDHVQLVQSTGREAQQDVFHLHVHIVPRRRGDGLDIHWSTHPELRSAFDQFLARLR